MVRGGASVVVVVAALTLAGVFACGGDDASAPGPACAGSCEGGSPAAPADALAPAVDAGDASPSDGDASATLACTTASQITAAHRFAPTMYGGWGAHLGHLLRSATKEAWFVDDTGTNVDVNAGLAYYKLVAGAWTRVASNTFPGNVQQNTGSLMSTNVIFTYGVDVTNNRMVECSLDTTTTTAKACADLPFDTGASSNYTGATISKSGTKVVWWTNTTGSFSYIYDFGGGWNGPVKSTLPGYADFSYVYARLAADNSHIEFHGASAHAQGGAAVGYDALQASTALGEPITSWQLVAANAIALETWLDPNGGTHFFTTGTTPLYAYKPKDGTLASQPPLAEPGALSTRIVETATTAYLVISFGDGSVRRKPVALAAINGPIDWNAIPDVDVAVPAGLGGITLYPESAMYQTNAVEPSFAMNGLSNQGEVLHIGCN